jgi:acetyl esterase/lipase
MGLLGAAVALLLAACTPFYLRAINLPADFGGYQRIPDLRYGSQPRQSLDIYLPRGGGAGHPVIVFWYGGGWVAGSKEEYRFVGAALARAGYVVVIPDYRLYPAVRFPVFDEDSAAAFVWVHAHIAGYGADPTRLFVMGHSAGAYQAAMLAFDPRLLAAAGGERRWIRGFIGLSGPYALIPNSPVLEQIFAPPYGPRDWQPLRFVDGGAPPCAIFQGDDDTTVSPSNAADLAAALRAAGVSVELYRYPGLGHAATVASLSVIARWRVPELAQIGAFIARNDRSR